MARVQITKNPLPTIKIAGQDISANFKRFEWASFVNAGYIVRAQIHDPYHNWLQRFATEKKYLELGRKEPFDVKFKIDWAEGPKMPELKKAIITDLSTTGTMNMSMLEFIAIDPPSWFLNRGDADGSVFKGRVSDVIDQVVKKYTKGSNPKIKLKISKTQDNEENFWWMHRQDPKTFIMSLLDWSSSLTKNKTHWIIASDDEKLIIQEQRDALQNKFEFDVYSVNQIGAGGQDVTNYSMFSDNYLTPLHVNLTTAGISAISGQYLDKTTDQQKKKVFARDKTTDKKINADVDEDHSFEAPGEMPWATQIMAIPEHSAGDVGIKYENYIDGRARYTFLRMLSFVMRIKVTVFGDVALNDSTKLGVSTAILNWEPLPSDIESKPFFLGGVWLVYGFHHIVTRAGWKTDIYLYRYDHDAKAKEIR